MRKVYKDIPLDTPNPMFPERLRWEPMLYVRLNYRHAQSQRFPAYVDSGSPYCLFRWELATMIGLNPEKDNIFVTDVGGIVHGLMERVYFQKITLAVETDYRITITAGFMKKLNATGILGRNGFFDSFKVTFDHSGYPPSFEIEKIVRPT